MALSHMTFRITLYKKINAKNPAKIQNNFGNSNKNSKVCTIKILLDSGASASIVCKDVLSKRHKIHKNKRSKWSNMAGMFNTSYMINLEQKLSKLNHTVEINVKYH